MTLILRSWAALAGLLTVIALSSLLTPIEQGYYFTFATLIAMQVFFELGLNQVITQVVSHEAARLKIDKHGALRGDPRGAARVAGLNLILRNWYRAAAVTFVVVVGAVGYGLFASRGTLSTGDWLPAWLFLVVATSANLRLSPFLAVAEGLGHVGQVARLRLVQSIVGYVVLWVVLILGGGLWAVAAVPSSAAICTDIWLRRRSRQDLPAEASDKISWRREILPFQWRIAVSWMSGYFIFSLFTPVVFARHGPIEAGRVGMALTIFTAISTIGLSWVNAKAPVFGGMVARGERDALNRLFLRVALRSTAAVIAACLVLVLGVSWAASDDLEAADRIVSPLPLLLLALATVANAIVFACATYMRSHRQEPMLTQSVVVAVAVAVSVVGLEAVTPMFAGYAAITILVGVPWTLILFRSYYRNDRRATSSDGIWTSSIAIQSTVASHSSDSPARPADDDGPPAERRRA